MVVVVVGTEKTSRAVEQVSIVALERRWLGLIWARFHVPLSQSSNFPGFPTEITLYEGGSAFRLTSLGFSPACQPKEIKQDESKSMSGTRNSFRTTERKPHSPKSIGSFDPADKTRFLHAE